MADTVADIVIADPRTAQVFERHNIDFCCHGGRPLEEACADAGVAVEVIAGELAALGATPAPSPAVPLSGFAATADTVGGLIDHILVTHHRYLKRALPRTARLMEQVVAAHAIAHPEVHEAARLLTDLRADLLPHLMKEERALFPMVIELLGAVEPLAPQHGTIAHPIAVMGAEHDRVGALLSELRALIGSYQPPTDACPTWRALYAALAELEADTHMHVHLENNVLFPRLLTMEAALRG